MKSLIFQYKCRRCNSIFEEGEANSVLVRTYLMSLAYGTPPPKICIGIPKHLLELHPCKDGGYGIADLIGAKEKDHGNSDQG